MQPWEWLGMRLSKIFFFNAGFWKHVNVHLFKKTGGRWRGRGGGRENLNFTLKMIKIHLGVCMTDR